MQRKTGLPEAEIKAKASYDIIAVGFAADEYALDLLKNENEKLNERFPAHYLKEAQRLCSEYPDESIIKSIVSKNHDTSLWPAGEGGVYGTLWWLTAVSSVGMRVFIDEIPVRQETIQLCSFTDVDPYRAASKGFYLIAAPNGKMIESILNESGIPACIIGYAAGDNDKLLIGKEGKQYLTKA